jgi:hypothetical protein
LFISPGTIRINKLRGGGGKRAHRVRHMGKTSAHRMLVEKTKGKMLTE